MSRMLAADGNVEAIGLLRRAARELALAGPGGGAGGGAGAICGGAMPAGCWAT